MSIRERRAIRGILLSPQREVLLLRAEPPGVAPFWETPGGGIEVGESDEAGLRRELREEVGLEHFTVGPLLARRQFIFNSAKGQTRQTERLYLVETARFEPVMNDPVEALVITRMHWWPLAQLGTTPEPIFPPQLPQLIQNYLEHGAPLEEITLDVE